MADEPDVSDDTDDTDDQQPVERLQDHLAEVSEKPDAMQERLDHLEEGIEAARRQAEADDLLPEAAEIPVDDSEFESGG